MTFDYVMPEEGATRLFGTLTDKGHSYPFECPILYVDGVMDLEATLARMEEIHDQAMSVDDLELIP